MHDVQDKKYVNSDNVNGTAMGNKEYTCDEALELTGYGRYNYHQLLTCYVLMLAAALDMFAYSVTVTAATCDLQLTVSTAGLLASAPFAGLISALPWGYYADTRGRRRALLASTIAGFIFAGATSLAHTWQLMFGLKMVGCAFSTAAFTITMTYLGECTDSKHRSCYLFIANSGNLTAEIVCYSLAYFLLPLTFNKPIPWLGITFRPWRLYCLLLATPLGIGALMMIPLMESPKFLAATGQKEQALEVLKTMFQRNGGNRDEYVVKSLSKDPTSATNESFWRSVVHQTVPIFKPPLLWRTLQLFYLVAVCCSTNNVFLMWYPTMVNYFFNSVHAGSSEDKTFCSRVVGNVSANKEQTPCNDAISPYTIYAGLILGVLFASLNLVTAALATHRRAITLASFAVSAICLVLVNQISNPIGNLIAFTLVQSTAVGVSCFASYFVDLYPTAFRGLSWSMAMMIGRLSTLGGLNMVGALLVNHCTATFYCWALYVTSALVLAFFLPKDKILGTNNE